MSTDSPDLLTSADDVSPTADTTPSTPAASEVSFDAFYATTFAPFIAVMEPQRAIADTKAKKHLFTLAKIVIAAIIACQLFILLTKGPMELWWFFAVVIAIGSFIGGFFALAPVGEFQRNYKKAALNRVLTSFGTFDDQEPDERPPSKLRDSLIVPPGDKQSFGDRIHGVHRGITVNIEEIQTYEHRETEVDGKRRTKTVPLFLGILVTVDYHRSFHGVTVLRQERGRSHQYGSAGELETVSLEDPDFEQTFEVLSNDQVEARYLLTPDFMVRLLAFAKAHREPEPFTLNLFLLSNRVTRMQCSFVGSSLHLAIPTTENRFELLHAKTESGNRESAERVFIEIRDLLAVIDALKIENRT